MKVLLVSTYELGHQPLGVAAAGGALRARGHEVRALDLAQEPWDPEQAGWADAVAFSVPMHTATRLARDVARTIQDRPVAFYGLYAAMGGDLGDALVDRDPLAALVAWVEGSACAPTGALPGPVPPARDLLPPLERYVRLARDGAELIAGGVEASTGCSHRCRHCPVPVVHDGRTRAVPVEAVLADVEQLVRAGARHISFADPDFLNRPAHARRVAAALHGAFPLLTFDCTVKVEHVLRHAEVWGELAAAGCLFVVSAFESLSARVLHELEKGHTPADASRAVAVLRHHGITVRPSWLPFTPWSTLGDVHDIAEFVAAHDLVGDVDPVQYTIRLLVPRGSLLIGRIPGLGPFDAERLTFTWSSALDPLQARLADLVEDLTDAPVEDVYQQVRIAVGLPVAALGAVARGPRLTEAWFCCAEPTATQRGAPAVSRAGGPAG